MFDVLLYFLRELHESEIYTKVSFIHGKGVVLLSNCKSVVIGFYIFGTVDIINMIWVIEKVLESSFFLFIFYFK